MNLKRDRQESDDFEVWPDNWPAVELFLALGTQFRRAPSGRLEGLDYTAIPIVAEGIGREWKPIFGDLQVIERAFIEEVNQ